MSGVINVCVINVVQSTKYRKVNLEQRTPYKAKVLLFAADTKCKPMIFVCGKKTNTQCSSFFGCDVLSDVGFIIICFLDIRHFLFLHCSVYFLCSFVVVHVVKIYVSYFSLSQKKQIGKSVAN